MTKEAKNILKKDVKKYIQLAEYTTDEEKKAIDKLKRNANYFVMPIYETKIILNLIEKQSKEIEEKLKEYYEFLTIEVEYAKIKTYKIFISVTLTDYRNSDVIKGVEFYYKWEDHLTFTANIEQMRYNIEKAIIKFFRKEDKNDKK